MLDKLYEFLSNAIQYFKSCMDVLSLALEIFQSIASAIADAIKEDIDIDLSRT